MFIDYLETPIGLLEIKATEQAIYQIIYCGNQQTSPQSNEHTLLAKQQLQEYFTGERKTFDLRLNPRGTDFQQSVWQHLSKIPFGEIRSYGAIAKQMENPNASQAVGTANGRNPIAIIVPCHRVIGANGALVGYAGGIERKQWLLKHEKVNAALLAEPNELTKAALTPQVKNKRQSKTQFLK